MKKLLSVLFALALVVACVWVCSTDAHAATQGDYTYTVSDGVAAITGYSGSGGNVTIPATLGGCPVTTIGNFAFYDCSSLTSVTIGNSVKTIGEEAFSDCTSLTSVTIPNSVTTMGDWVFYGCDSLTAVTIPGSVKIIGDGAFCDCASLTKIHVSSNNAYYSNDSKGVLFNKNKTTLIQAPGAISGSYTIPNSVTTIGERAFYACDSLTSVTIPDSITTIGKYAFSNCDSLTSATIPDSVTTIGKYAFSNCDSLTSVTIPDSVTTIGDWAFYSCASLTKINVSSNNAYYSNDSKGVLFNKDKTTLIQAPGAISGSYTIPNSVTTIGYSAFEYCASLTRVTIGDSVTAIGSYAFSWCDSLTSVTIPGSVKTIGDLAFRGCASLTKINVSSNNAFYSSDAQGVLFNKNKTTLIQAPGALSGSYAIPNSVTTIGDSAFNNCDSLTSVTIGNGVTEINSYAFYGCESLDSVFIPLSVEYISWGAFDGCDSLQSVYYAGNESQWENIYIDDDNDPLTVANVYYNTAAFFPDVKPNAWYYNAVQFAVKNGYFSGNGDGTFGPGNDITRQDFVVVMSRIAKADLSKYNGKTNFTDVPSNAYYAKAIHWATANGIISGYNATKFGVGDKLTREQLVTIFSRYAQKKGVNVTPSAAALNKLNSYSDANKINPAMKNAVAWALDKKVISGMTSTTVGPQGKATRAQVAAILLNINAYKVIPGI